MIAYRWQMSAGSRLATVGRVVGRTLDGMINDRVSGLAAEAAFFALLSLPPLVQRGVHRVLGDASRWFVTATYWPFVVLFSIAALATLYHLAVPVRTPWRRDLPGAVLALAIWVGGSVVLRLYLGATVHAGS